MSAEIIQLADRRKLKSPRIASLLALSFGWFAAYLFVGALIYGAMVKASDRS